ncbi:Crp/Fnr family transcriptional regulator [Clostridium botulinum]|uniref:Crp/Fnr family transcriptional regulator n=1 Tax=Clostridium botulinum TaxID=1491 RepID=UPI0004D93D1A|nr:Crp/Fnr family transcriptional regulator [Clostridium botulinum]KEI02483.1 Crp/Fnr family transcriptional regulator [Clostridium botulinum C/D str. BKT75002]KEI09693.1 Crp/Fnr family transcriptional regulator [Clostridium botulinum C/D str. BKT2873]QPW61146.1 Crp/Fnr family transcriptional regulator [Clostridium botulinum]
MLNEEKLLMIPIFRELEETTLRLLEESVNSCILNKGEVLFREREKIDKIYVVLSGKVTIYRNNAEGHKKVIYILDAGQMINEVILDGKPTSINCEAFESTEILWFNSEKFFNIMQKDFKLTKEVMNMMSKKIRRLYRQLKNTVPIRVDKKVAAKLWKLAKDYGVDLNGETEIQLKITVTSLAEMLGSSRETISRALKLLTSEGLIRYKNKKFIINRSRVSKYFKGV